MQEMRRVILVEDPETGTHVDSERRGSRPSIGIFVGKGSEQGENPRGDGLPHHDGRSELAEDQSVLCLICSSQETWICVEY